MIPFIIIGPIFYLASFGVLVTQSLGICNQLQIHKVSMLSLRSTLPGKQNYPDISVCRKTFEISYEKDLLIAKSPKDEIIIKTEKRIDEIKL
mgnify:CR=1 FL=1